jgi:hypothetical protein
MASVSINKGPVDYRDQMQQVDRLKWRELFIKRQQYIHTEFEHGCECVIDWLAEAEEFYEELGHASADEMLEKELEIPPDWVRMAAAVLEATGENLSKAEVDHAIELKKHGGDRRSETFLAQHGGDRRSEDQDVNHSLVYGTGNADYIKARLRRDHPEIAEQLEAGEFKSARQAGIAAGFVKDVPTVRMNAPAKAAAIIIRRMGVEWASELATAIADLASRDS